MNSAAKVLEQGEPELIQAVEENRLPLYLAEQVADLDQDEQREVAEQPTKRDASAKAKEKLGRLPTLGEAMGLPPVAPPAPVIKPLEPSRFVLFAEALMKTSALGHPLTPSTVDGLAREHELLADADRTFNLSREAVLAVELARKRLSIDEGKFAGLTAVIMGSAGLSTVYRINEGGSSGPVAVSLAGGELHRAQYEKALAALTEPKGKLHQSTAEPAIRAGQAAKVSYAQMAEDLGHPVGTILTWVKRLELTGKGEGRSAPRPRGVSQ